MAQHDYVIANGTGAAVRSDLNNGLAAIVSNNSGASEPATMYAYQWWSDTTTGLLKLRNAANNAWVTVGTLASANLGLAALASPTFTGTVTAPTFTASTAVNIPLGSAGSPTLFFTGDTNNGLFSPGADIVALTTDGSERFRIAASGQIGLGGANYGTSGQALTSNGSGSAPTWQTPVSTSDKISEGNTEAEVVDTGSDGHFKVTTEGSERLRVDPSGRLLVGTSSGRNIGGANNRSFQIESNTGASITRNSNDAGGGSLCFGKSRGTSAGDITVVQNGDTIGVIFFAGADGTDLETIGAAIAAEVDGTPGSNDLPTRLVFSTCADGASSPTERMRITQSGAVAALGVWNVTTATAANVNVDSNGLLQRSTSSARYKTDIETLHDSYADTLLNCRPVWYRSTCTSDNPDWGWWGFIAEEVAAIDPRLVHWKTFEVTYDKKGSAVSTPCDPEPEGVAYDRFVPHLLNLIKRQGKAIAELQAEVAALKAS